jgi:hypothetical protein
MQISSVKGGPVHGIGNKTEGRAYSNRFQCAKEFAWNIAIRCWSRVNQNSKDIIKKEHLTLTRDESAINESNERSGLHFRRCLLLECKVEYKLLNFQTLLKRRNARRQRNSISIVFSQRDCVAAVRLGAKQKRSQKDTLQCPFRARHTSLRLLTMPFWIGIAVVIEHSLQLMRWPDPL